MSAWSGVVAEMSSSDLFPDLSVSHWMWFYLWSSSHQAVQLQRWLWVKVPGYPTSNTPTTASPLGHFPLHLFPRCDVCTNEQVFLIKWRLRVNDMKSEAGLTGVVQEQNQRYNPCQENMSGSDEKSWAEHIFKHPSILRRTFTHLLINVSRINIEKTNKPNRTSVV